MMASKYNWRITLPQREVTLTFTPTPPGSDAAVPALNILIKENGQARILPFSGGGISVQSLSEFIDMLQDAKAAASSYFTEK